MAAPSRRKRKPTGRGTPGRPPTAYRVTIKGTVPADLVDRISTLHAEAIANGLPVIHAGCEDRGNAT